MKVALWELALIDLLKRVTSFMSLEQETRMTDDINC